MTFEKPVVCRVGCRCFLPLYQVQTHTDCHCLFIMNDVKKKKKTLAGSVDTKATQTWAVIKTLSVQQTW